MSFGALAQILFILLAPLLASRVSKMASWLNAVLFCYLIGIAVGNLPFLEVDQALSNSVTEAAIPLAIPLLLFSTDFRAWLRHGGPAVISFVLACVAACTASFVMAQIFSSQIEDFWKIGGMLVGVYTGGTPNMLSIGMALEVQEETFILLNAADVIISGAYLLFLMTIGKPLLRKLLPAFKHDGSSPEIQAVEKKRYNKVETLKSGGLSLLLAILILGFSAGGSLLIFDKMPVAPVIFSLTTLGILASLSDKVRALAFSSTLGNYFILVFCVAIGTLTNLTQLMNASSSILLFCAGTLALGVALHVILGMIFRIDADTLIITSTAAVFGPAFVPPIAKMLKNQHVLLSGLTTGLVGYAAGNYLGLALAYLLKP